VFDLGTRHTLRWARIPAPRPLAPAAGAQGRGSPAWRDGPAYSAGADCSLGCRPVRAHLRAQPTAAGWVRATEFSHRHSPDRCGLDADGTVPSRSLVGPHRLGGGPVGASRRPGPRIERDSGRDGARCMAGRAGDLLPTSTQGAWSTGIRLGRSSLTMCPRSPPDLRSLGGGRSGGGCLGRSRGWGSSTPERTSTTATACEFSRCWAHPARGRSPPPLSCATTRRSCGCSRGRGTRCP